MREQHYLCVCGFQGTEDDFERHIVSRGYDYGHNDCAPAEYELECPSCGQWEDDSIFEAETCRVCGDDVWHLADDIKDGKCTAHQNSEICPECGNIRDKLFLQNPQKCIVCQLDEINTQIQATVTALKRGKEQ